MTDLDTRFTGYANAVAANAQNAAQTYAAGQATNAQTAAQGYADNQWATNWSTAAQGYATAAQTAAEAAAQAAASSAQTAAQGYADNQWNTVWNQQAQTYANQQATAAQTAAQGYADNQWNTVWNPAAQTFASQQAAAAQTAAQDWAQQQWTNTWSKNVNPDIWNQDQTFNQKLTVANGLTVGGPSAYNGVVGLTDTLTAAPGKGIVYGGMSMFDQDGKTCLGSANGVPIFCMDTQGNVTNSAGQNVYLVTNDGPLSPLAPPRA